MSMIKLIGQ